MILVENLYGI